MYYLFGVILITVISRKAFGKEELLYIPESKSSDIWQWEYLCSCIWKAPDWFFAYTALDTLDDYKQLYGLFVNSLQVCNLAIQDCISMLEDIRDKCYGSYEEQETNTYRLYTELNKLVEAEEDRDAAKDQIRCARIFLIIFKPPFLFDWDESRF